MKMFLMITGGFLVALALFVLLLLLWIRAKFRQFARNFGEKLKGLVDSAQTIVPPARIHLQRCDELEFQQEDAVEALAKPLREAGFEAVGRFEAETPGPLYILALACPQQSIYAAIYEKEPAGVWLDLVTRYSDGTAFTCSNAKYQGMKHRPGKEVEILPETDAETLYRHFLERRPQHATDPVAAEKFVEVFERAYAEDMDWQLERGGPTEEEIRKMMETQGNTSQPEAEAHTITLVRQMWQARGNEHLQERLRENLLAHTPIPAAQWEEIRDRLVFVHDRMDCQTLLGHFEEQREEETEEAAAEEIVAGQSPRAAFAQLNGQLPAERRFEKFAVVTQPVEADVYLAPPQADD